MISITRVHTPVWSDARTASRDSSTASATPCGYVCSSSRVRYSSTWQRPQPLQVRPVPQVLPGDHRRGLSQRQRQMPQLGGHRRGSGVIRQAGPPGQERQRLLGTEHVHRDAGPQVRHRLLVHW